MLRTSAYLFVYSQTRVLLLSAEGKNLKNYKKKKKNTLVPVSTTVADKTRSNQTEPNMLGLNISEGPPDIVPLSVEIHSGMRRTGTAGVQPGHIFVYVIRNSL